LKRVKEGKPLTIPLAVLNGEFKKKYFVCLNCGAPISDGNLSGYCRKCIKKKYHQRPEVKKRKREYSRKYMRERYRKKNKIPKSKWRVKDGKN